jgi:hypothetical protein
MDEVVVGKALSTLGKAAGGALIHNAQEAGIPIPPELTDPSREAEPGVIVPALRDIAARIFPRLTMNTQGTEKASGRN